MNPFRTNPQAPFNFGELLIDSFAGGGGASMGIEMATGRQAEPVLFEDCGPGCLRGPCPEGGRSCGKPPKQ